MYAYRVVEIRLDLSRTLHAGQHDGSEEGSGIIKRLSSSRLLQELQYEKVVVVVSRKYRGVKLGSNRWRLFSMAAKDVLQRAAAAAIVKEKAPGTPNSHSSHSSTRK
jgi:putative IMPACT (imprinted ancient) family translation regulator